MSRADIVTRMGFGLSCVVLGYACASEGEPSNAQETTDAGTVIVDAGGSFTDGAKGDGASAVADPRCSDDGWCLTDFEIDTMSFSAVWGSGPTDVWFAGTRGRLVHWNGARWDVQTVVTPLPDGADAGPPPETFYSIWGSGPNDVYAVTIGGTVAHCQAWNGSSAACSAEALPATPIATNLSSVWGSSSTDVWLAGGNAGGSRSLHSIGWQGTSADWITVLDVIAVGDPRLAGIFGSSAMDVWALGPRGRLFHSNGYADGLADWTPVNSATTANLKAGWAAGADDAWIVGDRGVIRHFTYDQYGVLEWLPSDAGTTVDLSAVWGSGPTDVWTVGADDTILHGDGTGWRKSSVPAALAAGKSIYGIWGSGPDDVWAVGDGVLLHRSPRAGTP